MFPPCAMATCKYLSRAQCLCCKQNLCRDHFNDHADQIKIQLDPLIDKINAFRGRLTVLNIERMKGDSHQKLEHWRDECHKTIDQFFEQKCQELDQHVNEKMAKQQTEFQQIQSKINELINEDTVTLEMINSLTTSVDILEEDMNEIEQTFVQVDIRPLLLQDNFVYIGESKLNQLNLTTISPACKKIRCHESSWSSIASSDRFLLIEQKKTLYLVDRELIVVKQKPWLHDYIMDVCWSSTLSQFIITMKNDVYRIDEQLTSHQRIKTIPEQNWYSCSCSETSLFLSTNELGSSIMEFSLLPSIQLVRQWQSPVTCLMNERILDIIYNNNVLALMVLNQIDNIVHMELKSITKFERLWSISLDITYKYHISSCCSLKWDEWLIIDGNTSRLIHIDKDGQIKNHREYEPLPCYATLFGPDTLAISTEKCVNFHKV